MPHEQFLALLEDLLAHAKAQAEKDEKKHDDPTWRQVAWLLEIARDSAPI
jgi:hypothetical protein